MSKMNEENTHLNTLIQKVNCSDIKKYFSEIYNYINNDYLNKLLLLIRDKTITIENKDNTVGIRNKSHYCYRNSLLQVLLHTSIFKEYIYNIETIKTLDGLDKDCNLYITALQKFFKEYYQSGKKGYIDNLKNDYLPLLTQCKILCNNFEIFKIYMDDEDYKMEDYLKGAISQEDSTEFFTESVIVNIEKCIPIIKSSDIQEQIKSNCNILSKSKLLTDIYNYITTDKNILNIEKDNVTDAIMSRYLSKKTEYNPNILNLLFEFCSKTISKTVFKIIDTDEEIKLESTKLEMATEIKIQINPRILRDVTRNNRLPMLQTQEIYDKMGVEENILHNELVILDSHKDELKKKMINGKKINNVQERIISRCFDCGDNSKLESLTANEQIAAEKRYGSNPPSKMCRICGKPATDIKNSCVVSTDNSDEIIIEIEERKNKYSFERLPNILMICISRFKKDQQFYHIVNDRIVIQGKNYYLYGVTHKLGPPGGGHYISL